MSQPIILPSNRTDLYRQVQAYLETDTDPVNGLVPALGNGVQSIFPNFTTDGPNKDRTLCPTPFLIILSGGIRAHDQSAREYKIFIEIHDDSDHGDLRWPGILTRLKEFLLVKNAFRPQDDPIGRGVRYLTSVYFEEESPPNLQDTRYDTNVVQLILVARAMDRTSNRNYNG